MAHQISSKEPSSNPTPITSMISCGPCVFAFIRSRKPNFAGSNQRVGCQVRLKKSNQALLSPVIMSYSAAHPRRWFAGLRGLALPRRTQPPHQAFHQRAAIKTQAVAHHFWLIVVILPVLRSARTTIRNYSLMLRYHVLVFTMTRYLLQVFLLVPDRGRSRVVAIVFTTATDAPTFAFTVASIAVTVAYLAIYVVRLRRTHFLRMSLKEAPASSPGSLTSLQQLSKIVYHLQISIHVRNYLVAFVAFIAAIDSGIKNNIQLHLISRLMDFPLATLLTYRRRDLLLVLLRLLAFVRVLLFAHHHCSIKRKQGKRCYKT